MLPELTDRFATLDRTRFAFLEVVRAASGEQRKFRPLPGAWSMQDVTEHLVLAEEKSLLGVQKGPPPGTLVTPAAHVRMGMVRFVLASSLRVKVPVPTVVPEGSATLAELEVRWEAARRGMAAAFEPIGASDLGAARFRHPIAGWVTAGEGLGFLAGHIRHHARQLRRVRQASGFPAT
jgi:hypothetical protein